MSKKLNSEDLNLLNTLTDEQKNKWYIRSIIFFISLYLFLIIFGTYATISDIYCLFIENSRYRYWMGWGIVLIIFCIVSLIEYLLLSREKKILKIYKLANNRHVIKDKKIRFLLWLTVILILIATICPFFFVLIANKHFNPWLLLVLISGIFISSLIWYGALSKKEK